MNSIAALPLGQGGNRWIFLLIFLLISQSEVKRGPWARGGQYRQHHGFSG
jgi:hypothetical protein